MTTSTLKANGKVYVDGRRVFYCQTVAISGLSNRPQRISSTTAQRIADVLGHAFVFVSFSLFEEHGQLRGRYTVKRPHGGKFIHLVRRTINA